MREEILKRGMALEHAYEVEAGGSNGGVYRIADEIAEIVGRQPVRPRHVDGVKQDERAELRRRRPDRLELGIVEVPAGDVRTDLRAAQAERAHGVAQLVGGKLRRLQRQRGDGEEA